MIRKISFCLFFLFLITNLYSDEILNEKPTEAVEEIENDSNTEDSPLPKITEQNYRKIKSLFTSLEEYRPDESDNSVTAKKKSNDFKLALLELNKRKMNSDFSVTEVFIDDIEEETEISKAGEKKIKAQIAELKNNPLYKGYDFDNEFFKLMFFWGTLMSCSDCMQPTGRYELKVSLVDGYENKYSNVKISKILPKNSSELTLKKGSKIDLKGKIISLQIRLSNYSEDEIEIKLK